MMGVVTTMAMGDVLSAMMTGQLGTVFAAVFWLFIFGYMFVGLYLLGDIFKRR